jgi:4-hydroxy-tetrahydrodipicolinate synthase
MFKGAYTAIVTPFAQGGAVDYEALERLIEGQIAGGIDGLVPVGTTGESPTLDMDEHQKVIEFTIEKVARRCKVIAGTGANATAEAIELTQHARAAGADGCL